VPILLLFISDVRNWWTAEIYCVASLLRITFTTFGLKSHHYLQLVCQSSNLYRFLFEATHYNRNCSGLINGSSPWYWLQHQTVCLFICLNNFIASEHLSVPLLWFLEVITTLPLKTEHDRKFFHHRWQHNPFKCFRSLFVTLWIIVLPPKSIKGFPGNLVEAYRAGIIPINCM